MKEIQTSDVRARPAPKNAIVLSIAQGLFTAAISVDLTLTGLTGYQLAPNKSLATLPFALITVAGALATLFASLLMQRIGRRKGFIVGALTCALGGAVSVQDGAKIIQWHLVGMYAPSLFAGRLINRFGIPTILFSGMALTLTCALVAIASSSLFAFYVGLLCLGVGWNFMFVGGTTLLAESHRPHERARVQGAAELIRYALTTLATLGAGPMLEHYGWRSLNLSILPMLAVSAYMTLAWTKSSRRRAFSS